MRELTFKEEEKLLIALSDRWTLAKMFIRLSTVESNVLTAHEHFDVMMSFFYNQLDEDCKDIYNRAYLKKQTLRLYEENYSRSNYYRKKRLIVKTFVHCLQVFKVLK